ncbi:MAG: type II/IV secretion system protein [bacterium]
MTAQQIYDIVLKSKLVPSQRLDEARHKAEAIERPFEDVLISDGLITGDFLAKEIAKSQGIPFVDLEKYALDPAFIKILSSGEMEKYQAVVFEVRKQEVLVATTLYPNPNLEAKLKARGFVKVAFFFPDAQALKKAVNGLQIASRGDLASFEKKGAVDILNQALDYAIFLKASDIHFERQEKEVLIRFRVDGVLSDIAHLPTTVHPELVSRIKILSNLKLDEKLRPQDGRFSHHFGGQRFDLRVSILPSNFGESCVLRLLASGARPQSLASLGFSGQSLNLINKHLKNTFGMILATGPTGSGKTTTLYSLINLINVPEVKICTIEDPVEYSLNRATQIQVNRRAELTFANGLRSLLRHDPDIMMVGEIRDPETADLAINAALTGHLVFSTLHTNDAVGFFDRLVDLDVPPFLLSSTVSLVVAQRLVRKVCKKCTESYKPDPTIVDQVEKLAGKSLKKSTFFKGRGCSFCGNTGFSGRVGIYEVLPITPALQGLMTGKYSSQDILKEAQKAGFLTMVQDGVEKAEGGFTTLEEVLRVVGKA